MQEGTDLQVIKDQILSCGDGKYDFVEKILTREEILYSRPLIVFKNITKRLSIDEDKINRKTFWSWLSRYKKRHGLLNPEAGATKLTRESKMHPVYSISVERSM